MIVGIIILIMLALLYIGLPLWLQIIIAAINTFIPDTIPILDEVFMFVNIFNKIIKIDKIVTVWEWLSKHKVITILICVVIIFGITIAFYALAGYI